MTPPDHAFWPAIVALLERVPVLGLISFGGVNSVLPALHHQAVNEQHWMTDRDFANLFALASVSPGPNFMVLALIGYKAAGVPRRAIVATLALCIPTSLLVFAVVKVWDRFQDRPLARGRSSRASCRSARRFHRGSFGAARTRLR